MLQKQSKEEVKHVYVTKKIQSGAATLGGSGCMRATYGCPKHGGPIGVHGNTTLGAYQNDNGFHSEKSCLGHALGYWRYCGSNPKYPITYIYLPTGILSICKSKKISIYKLKLDKNYLNEITFEHCTT
jgi:hypothetical protein